MFASEEKLEQDRAWAMSRKQVAQRHRDAEGLDGSKAQSIDVSLCNVCTLQQRVLMSYGFYLQWSRSVMRYDPRC